MRMMMIMLVGIFSGIMLLATLALCWISGREDDWDDEREEKEKDKNIRKD